MNLYYFEGAQVGHGEMDSFSTYVRASTPSEALSLVIEYWEWESDDPNASSERIVDEQLAEPHTLSLVRRYLDSTPGAGVVSWDDVSEILKGAL